MFKNDTADENYYSQVGQEMCRKNSPSECFLWQAEDVIRYLVRSRGLGDVYKRQVLECPKGGKDSDVKENEFTFLGCTHRFYDCLLYISDAADDLLFVDVAGRRIISNKRHIQSVIHIPICSRRR